MNKLFWPVKCDYLSLIMKSAYQTCDVWSSLMTLSIILVSVLTSASDKFLQIIKFIKTMNQWLKLM